MAASARRMIHSAMAGGMPCMDVPLVHCTTTARPHPSWSAKVEAVQPSKAMHSLICIGPMIVR